MQKQKSTNLHDFDHELFLGFVAEQPLPKTQYEVSFVGGQPLWLNEPNQKLLTCQECTDQSLTFLAQVFCPLDAKHCYNRILYLFYCEKCKRQFRCVKQQTDQNWQPKNIQSSKKTKVVTQQAFEIESDPMERKQMLKIINRAKIEVEEEIIMEEEDENDDDEEGQEVVVNVEKMTGEQMVTKLEEFQKTKKNKEYTEKQIEEINKKFESLKIDEKEEKQGAKQIQNTKKDHIFEQYIKTIKALNNPIMLYSNIAVPYNKTPLNPKHTCKYCGNKLQLEVQLTQKVLLFHKSLALLDWGSIFIYTCTASCKESEDQNVVLQYEFDAISENEIAKLRKTKKNRKKNKNKSLSKEKKRLNGENQQKKQKIQPEILKGSKQQENDSEGKQQEEGDWD